MTFWTFSQLSQAGFPSLLGQGGGATQSGSSDLTHNMTLHCGVVVGKGRYKNDQQSERQGRRDREINQREGEEIWKVKSAGPTNFIDNVPY